MSTVRWSSSVHSNAFGVVLTLSQGSFHMKSDPVMDRAGHGTVDLTSRWFRSRRVDPASLCEPTARAGLHPAWQDIPDVPPGIPVDRVTCSPPSLTRNPSDGPSGEQDGGRGRFATIHPAVCGSASPEDPGAGPGIWSV
ncbi:hypothetical protein GCM10020229_10880 [Kitasatospora albolonga]